MNASAGVILVDDPTFLQSFRRGDVLPMPWQAPTPAPVLAFAPRDQPLFALLTDAPAHVLPFSRSPLSDADADDLGVLLGQLLVARWRRETVAG